MFDIYCRNKHESAGPLCTECRELLDYAEARLAKCPFGENKPTCARCPIHCYKPAMGEAIRDVMRYAGPRMLVHHPVLALGHVLDGTLHRPPANRGRDT
jgi:hypothetical protein